MKKALIVVDMQRDFIDGALGFETAVSVIDSVVKKITQARQDNHTVVFTFDTHDKKYLDSEEGLWLPTPHAIEGTQGQDLHPRIEALKQVTDPVFDKETFGSLALGSYLEAQGFEEVELCGLVSSMCVFSNAIIAKSALPNAKIVVDSKATTSFDREAHEKTLWMLTHLHVHVV